MKLLLILVTIFTANFVYANTDLSGSWIFLGQRTCQNGNKIDDRNFTSKITGYSYQINEGATELLLEMTFSKNPISISYELRPLGEDNKYEASPKESSHGSSPFQIDFDGKVINALFEDSSGKFCGGGFIVTPMIKQ